LPGELKKALNPLKHKVWEKGWNIFGSYLSMELWIYFWTHFTCTMLLCLLSHLSVELHSLIPLLTFWVEMFFLYFFHISLHTNLRILRCTNIFFQLNWVEMFFLYFFHISLHTNLRILRCTNIFFQLKKPTMPITNF
jgi:hypothetical protein